MAPGAPRLGAARMRGDRAGAATPHLPATGGLAAQCLSLRKGQLVDLRRPG